VAQGQGVAGEGVRSERERKHVPKGRRENKQPKESKALE